jgi:Ferric reductase like transmembrane component
MVLWYATRATGVVALVLLTATVVLGVAGTARFAAPGLPRVVGAGLHRNLSLLVVGFVTVHVVTTVADSYTSIGLSSTVIPFNSDYRRLWLGLGTIAFDMLIAVTLTSLLRDRLSLRSWRAVHWLGYACWPVALWHGLGTGTDTRLPWLLALDALCVAAVAAAAWWRLSLAAPGLGRTAALAGLAVLPAVTAIFALAGPLQPGWPRRAGTPTALAGSRSSVVPSAGPSGHPSVAAATGPAVRYAGRVTRSVRAGRITITVRARTTRNRRLTIVLRGRPDGTGISMSSGTLRLGRTARQAAEQGPVTALTGQRLTAVLDGPREQQASLTLIISGARASGQLALRAES